MSQELNNEQILASAIRFLIDGNEREAASILFSCSLEEIYTEQRQDHRGQPYNVELIVIRCPRYAYDQLINAPLIASVANVVGWVLEAKTIGCQQLT